MGEAGSAASVLVWLVVGIVFCVVAVGALAVVAGGFGPDGRHISPFTAVRARGLSIEVRVDADFYELRSINGVTADDLARTAQREFDEQWVRRLGEDLDAVFLGRGAPMECPATVELVIDGEVERRTLKCTEENRERARNYNNR